MASAKTSQVFHLALFFILAAFNASGEDSHIRQVSDGCGPHPLIALTEAYRASVMRKDFRFSDSYHCGFPDRFFTKTQKSHHRVAEIQPDHSSVLYDPSTSKPSSLNDVLRAVRADPVVWSAMQNLLRRYDDCIRAADGLHYKRSDDSVLAAVSLADVLAILNGTRNILKERQTFLPASASAEAETDSFAGNSFPRFPSHTWLA